MTQKSVSGECLSCESSFSIDYIEELVSQELPECCPFCGEEIDELSESYIEDADNSEDDDEWD
jgi:hypothetical protein